jgi:hypothetical protein
MESFGVVLEVDMLHIDHCRRWEYCKVACAGKVSVTSIRRRR